MKRTALVTGAANGIGRACSLALARSGADIALLDINESETATVADEIRACGRQALTLRCDCIAANDLESAIKTASEQLGTIDVLINNVGQSARERGSEFWESEEATWRFVMEVSLFTVLRASRQVVPLMRERGCGRIINISSDAALAGDIGLADYASAKMGVLGFTRTLARELASFGVTVNAICPGTIRTRAHDILPTATLERICSGVPMGYVGEPEDVAALATFLAGPGGRYITGQTLLVDGGRWMI